MYGMYKAPPVCFLFSPSDIKERMIVTMRIFRKQVNRSSNVTIAIEADSYTEADKIFNDWLEDEKNREDFNDALNERGSDKEYWLYDCDNFDEYNRGSFTDDFLITKPRKEPTYDLYFTFKGSPGMAKVFMDCTMDMVVEKLHEFNAMYFLTRKDVNRKIQANVNKIHFECERR